MSPVATADRFWSKVQKTEACWLWTGALVRGYGSFRLDGRARYAHRVAYELLVGQIADGLVLDHLCRTKNCVRPDHLEQVTQRENILRGESPMAKQARQTHCSNSHPLADDNLMVDSKGKRRCRTCNREWYRARRVRRRSVALDVLRAELDEGLRRWLS